MKKTRLRQISKSPKRKLELKADKLWQEAMALIHRGEKCFLCEKNLGQIGHHFTSKKMSTSLRYDIENGIFLCFKCHGEAHSFCRTETQKTIMLKKGVEWYDSIARKQRQFVHADSEWYEANIERLKEIIDIERGKYGESGT